MANVSPVQIKTDDDLKRGHVVAIADVEKMHALPPLPQS
jgi:hypothetical protein